VAGDAELRRADLAPDPLDQFRGWFAEAAVALEVPEAMAVATATADAAPSVRMVLLKAVDDRGLVFYSHYTSRKGRELEANPQAALLFHWAPLGRQVRVEGSVERVSAEESDAYFATRPRGAQLGALASNQSEELGSRAELEARLAEVERDLGGDPVPRPPTWGGFRLVPAAWEFWQHRDDRLHDRFRYERDPSGGWRIERLFP
jgi:pyridoxamine 5'-phosphate oxidase